MKRHYSNQVATAPRDIIKSLPLLASILGRKYGVQVRIGGDTAYTNGKIIQLPSLPLDSDSNLLSLVRSYLDHEAAHIRETDFEELKQAGLSPFEKYVWNILEDWRVENKLASIYPGCRENFHWLIRHLFLTQPIPSQKPAKSKKKKQQSSGPDGSGEQLLNWLLITARAWDVPELNPEREKLKMQVEKYFPALPLKLEPILNGIRADCPNTETALTASKDITKIIRQYLHELEQQLQAQNSEQAANQPTNQSGEHPNSHPNSEQSQAIQSLRDMLASTADDACKNALSDLGRQISEKLSSICHEGEGSIQIAVPITKQLNALSAQAIDSTRQATTALRVRLQALLQGQCIIRNRSAFVGTLDTHNLHTLATGNTKLFVRRGERVGMNTAIHILLDRSGSMAGTAIQLANQACFAVASALQSMQGMSLAVTAFPGGVLEDGAARSWQTVLPILKHSQKLHTNFDCDACGSTPLDSALWWVVQQMFFLSETRKIILIMSDGRPDDELLARQAIEMARRSGFEVYGIGIESNAIADLLPGPGSRTVNDINELAPAMFAVLQSALIRN